MYSLAKPISSVEGVRNSVLSSLMVFTSSLTLSGASSNSSWVTDENNRIN